MITSTFSSKLIDVKPLSKKEVGQYNEYLCLILSGVPRFHIELHPVTTSGFQAYYCTVMRLIIGEEGWQSDVLFTGLQELSRHGI